MPHTLSSPQTSSQDKRERLVLAARDMVREGGMTALSLRTLAEREDTSTQAIYTLFGGKQGLLQAIYSHWISGLAQHIAGAGGTTPDALLTQAAYGYSAFAHSDPALFLAGSADPGAIALLHDSPAFHLLAHIVMAGMASGQLRPSPDPGAAAKALWGCVHGAVLFDVLAGGNGNEYLDLALPIMLRGLTHPG